MDELFGDSNGFQSNSFESFNEINYNINKNDNKLESKTTTIEKAISPIRKPFEYDYNYENMDELEDELSFNKSNNTRKYRSLKKSYDFSPVMRSTPKTSKTRKSRKKSKRLSISLWDKAIDKNPELREWIHSFNEDMKKIESSELSISQNSFTT